MGVSGVHPQGGLHVLPVAPERLQAGPYQVYEEYQVPESKRSAKSGEVDHFDPLCNGGSHDIKNLWYQPAKNMWNGKNFGYHEKDSLESWVCAQVKAGKLDPEEAFTRMTSDWVKFYMDINPKQVKFGD